MRITSWSKDTLFDLLGSVDTPMFYRNGVQYILMGVERESGGGKDYNVKARRTSDNTIQTFYVKVS